MTQHLGADLNDVKFLLLCSQDPETFSDNRRNFNNCLCNYFFLKKKKRMTNTALIIQVTRNVTRALTGTMLDFGNATRLHTPAEFQLMKSWHDLNVFFDMADAHSTWLLTKQKVLLKSAWINLYKCLYCMCVKKGQMGKVHISYHTLIKLYMHVN